MKTVIRYTHAILLASTLATAVAEQPAVQSYTAARDDYLRQLASDPRAGKISDADKAVMHQAADGPAGSLPEPGIRVGERAPDFTLDDAFGHALTLSRELQKGPVELVFYRGAWCPFCNLHLRTIHERLPEIRAQGAQLILVTPQTPDRSRDQLEMSGYPFRVLSDLDSRVIRDYRL